MRWMWNNNENRCVVTPTSQKDEHNHDTVPPQTAAKTSLVSGNHGPKLMIKLRFDHAIANVLCTDILCILRRPKLELCRNVRKRNS